MTSTNEHKLEWVLPKGHIEDGEGHIEAALREVEEETGVIARMVYPLGVVVYGEQAGTGELRYVRIKYYLLRWLFDSPIRPKEGRTIEWLSFEDALARLSFSESQRILLLAHHQQRIGQPTAL